MNPNQRHVVHTDSQQLFNDNMKMLSRLRKVKPVVKPLKVVDFEHLINNKKKYRLQEDRCTEIERQNSILF